MIIKRLKIENIRSYKEQEIVFPKGSLLLSGDIGCGKTTILLAVEFALFGLQPSQKGSSLLRNGEDNAKVWLNFEIDEKDIIIERTLKRSSKTVNQDYCSVTVDNEKFEGSVTEIKTKVLKLLNYPGEFAKKTNLLYKFTVYTPQEEMKQIILETGDVRLNTLRHVFGIDKYKRIEENTSILTGKLKEKIRLNEGILYDLEENKSDSEKIKKDIDTKKQKREIATKDYESAIEKRKEKEKELESVNEKIQEKKVFETEKAKTEILMSEKNQQVRSLESTRNSLKIQIEESRTLAFNQAEFNSLLQRIEHEEEKEQEMQKEYIRVISQINSEESRKRETFVLKNKIEGLEKCPTCLQEVSKEYKKNIINRTNEELQLIQARINELNRKKNELSEKTEEIRRKLKDLKKNKSDIELLKIKAENIKDKEEQEKNIFNQINSIKKDLEILRKHMETTTLLIQEYEKYDIIYEEKSKEVSDLKKSENDLAIKKAEISKEIQLLERQIKELDEKIKKKEEIKRKNEYLRELEFWISEKYLDLVLSTEKQVMFTLKEEFSKLFSKWFSILVGDSLNARLDDSFSPIIEQQDYELDYSFLSGGERTAIALAYRLALNQVINSLLSNIKTRNLVILDEPTDGFSSQQLDKMRDVLNQLNTEQLILVSHEQKIESFVDNIIRLRKDFGVTRVEG